MPAQQDEHEEAVKLALRTADELRKLFLRMGAGNNRGRLMVLYRQARRAFAGNTKSPQVVLDVLRELRVALEEALRLQFQEIAQVGLSQAQAELALYGLPAATDPADVSGQVQTVLAAFDAQAAQVRGLAQLGDEALILGDEERMGVLTPGPILREGARWAAVAALTAYAVAVDRGVRRANAQDDFLRQAVAALDGRTTNCCIGVHGQTVKMDEPFLLTGTPRFADRMMHGPFHYFCRTSQTLVRRSAAQDAITERMRSEAMNLQQTQEAEAAVRATEGDMTKRRSGRQSAPQGPKPITPKTTSQQVEGPTPEKLLYEWVHGAGRRDSIILKRAIREELGARGLIVQRRAYNISDGEVQAARPAVREMYRRTQAEMRQRGISEITLYRGVKSEIRTQGAVESWTTDRQTAVKFDGYDVMEMKIPAERVFMYSGGPGWKNGKYGEQYEYMILGSAPK